MKKKSKKLKATAFALLSSIALSGATLTLSGCDIETNQLQQMVQDECTLVEAGTTEEGETIYEIRVGDKVIGTFTVKDGMNGIDGVDGKDGEKGEKGDTGATGAKGEQGIQGEKGDKGDKGEKGDTGATGAKGEQGIQGKDGATWFTGTIVSDDDLTADVGDSKNGDMYLNTTTYCIYQFNDGEWTKIGTIKGADGEAGEDGATGAKGDQGIQGIQGEKGDKGDTGATGAKGEQGIQGVQGEKGDKGADGKDGTNGKDGEAGSDGLSAYEIYLKYNQWYVGDERQWVNDLIAGNLYSSVEEAIQNGQNVKLVEDLSVANISLNNAILDLNGNKLTVTNSFEIDGNVTIKNGEMDLQNAQSKGIMNIKVRDGETLTIDSVEMTVNGSGIGTEYEQENSVQTIVIKNSSIVSTGYYAVATNATTKSIKNYITIENSEISVSNNENDNCAVCFNTDGKLEIKNSTISGQRQGVMVRAGEAYIEGSTISVVSTFTSDKRNTGAWGSGNEVATGALIVGNKNAGGYNATAKVTLKNNTISGMNAEGNTAQVYDVYVVDTNTVGEVEYSATVEYIVDSTNSETAESDAE